MGAYLERPITTKDSDDGDGGRSLAFGSSGMQGWRTGMEDAHINSLGYDGDEDAGLFAVFDGHGGGEVAKFCHANLGDELLKLEEYRAGSYASALRRGFLRMDEVILAGWPKTLLAHGTMRMVGLDAEDSNPYQEGGPGCTATACIIKDGKFHVANAGDSRIVLCRGGVAIDLTEDHKPELDSERERIESAGGYISDGRVNGNLNLTRAIGDFAYKKDPSIPVEKQIITADSEMREQAIHPDDEFLILGCDGVYDRKTSQDVVDFVKPRIDALPEGTLLSKVAEDLLDDILSPNVSQTDGLGCDNMTCIIVDLIRNKRKEGYVPPPKLGGLAEAQVTINPQAAGGLRRPSLVQQDEK